jgi:hypothetical protein
MFPQAFAHAVVAAGVAAQVEYDPLDRGILHGRKGFSHEGQDRVLAGEQAVEGDDQHLAVRVDEVRRGPWPPSFDRERPSGKRD